MSDLLTLALVAGGFFLIFRLALGGTFWKRNGRHNLWLPSRDRDYTRGGLLGAMAMWGLAEVVSGSASSGESAMGGVYVLSAVLAAGYAVRQELVGFGLGLIGAVTLLLGRYTDDCVGITTRDNIRFWIGAVVVVVVLIGLRLVLTPVRAAVAVPAGLLNSFVPGRTRPGASVVLATFGALSLLNLATRPDVLELPDQWNAATVSATVTLAVALAGLAVGLTVLPNFTISVLSTGTFVATLLVDGVFYSCTSAVEWKIRLIVLACFLPITWIVGWAFGRR